MDSCAFCGADIGEGAQFCAKCGARLVEEPASPGTEGPGRRERTEAIKIAAITGSPTAAVASAALVIVGILVLAIPFLRAQGIAVAVTLIACGALLILAGVAFYVADRSRRWRS